MDTKFNLFMEHKMLCFPQCNGSCVVKIFLIPTSNCTCRRAFVVPRVLQQYKKVEEPQDYEEEEPEQEKGRDMFCQNPAELRERAEQRRQEARGRGRGRGSHSYDVVGRCSQGYVSHTCHGHAWMFDPTI